jgi:hypothetical protein
MKKSFGALLALFAASGMLTACNGTNGVGPAPTPTSGPTGNCGGPPSANQMEVLYPIPGTRKAPAALGNVYVSTKGSLPPSNQFDFYLSQSDGSSTYTGLFESISESQIPPPHAKPTYTNPVYYASAIAGPYGSSYVIGPDQAVSLFWNDLGRYCIPHFLVSSFHTKG